jgi:serine protease
VTAYPAAGVGTPPLLAGLNVQHDPRVYLLFWGPEWATDSSGIIQAQEALFNHLAGSRWNGILSQYGTATLDGGFEPINNDTVLAGEWIDTATAPPLNPSGQDVVNEIGHAMTTQGWTTSFDTQVVVLLQQGSVSNAGVVLGGCSFHQQGYDTGTNGHYLYVYAPYPTDTLSRGTTSYDCNWYNGGGPAGALTLTTSHEYAETVTDWGPGGGWTTSDDEEVADICETYYYLSEIDGIPITPSMFIGPGGVPVAPLWSNSANGCVFP